MSTIALRPRPAGAVLPREHGAYAELALPLVAALAARPPALASVSLALAACAAFVAHEPLLVLLGHRGARARRDGARAAGRWLFATGLLAGLLATAGLALAPPARGAALFPAALAAIASALAATRNERTLGGELVACLALPSAMVPVAVASGLAFKDAVAAWATFGALFALSTVEVRAIARRERHWLRAVMWVAALATLTAVGATRLGLALAAAPNLLAIAAVSVTKPRPAHLRRIGWTLAASSVVVAVGVAIALHAGAS